MRIGCSSFYGIKLHSVFETSDNVDKWLFMLLLKFAASYFFHIIWFVVVFNVKRILPSKTYLCPLDLRSF